VRFFLVGAVIALLSVGAGWAMFMRATEAFDRLASTNFSPTDDLHKDDRNLLSRIVSYTIMPYMAVIGAMISGLFFVFGILVVLTRATD
jgi:fatty-acid desaturase